MALFPTLRFGLLLALTGAAVTSCISPPEFPDTPSIKFERLTVVRQPLSAPGALPVDSVIVTVSFEDGDGDLGLTPEEYSNPPYQRTNADGSLNPNHWNYFIRLFVRNPTSGQFEPYTLTPDNLSIPPDRYYSQFPHLEPNPDKEAPLQGDLRFGLTYTLGSPFYPGQEVRFEVSIKDREFHESNTVTTSSFLVVR
ncbi:MAG: hypothetical protein H7Z21_06505 [Hymenobacter sp.]|nr:hypothetical protein [Hymenobacter sp.]